MYGAGAAFFAWSRPNLVGAGVSSGTLDIRSLSRPKKWRLRNTGSSCPCHWSMFNQHSGVFDMAFRFPMRPLFKRPYLPSLLHRWRSFAKLWTRSFLRPRHWTTKTCRQPPPGHPRVWTARRPHRRPGSRILLPAGHRIG